MRTSFVLFSFDAMKAVMKLPHLYPLPKGGNIFILWKGLQYSKENFLFDQYLNQYWIDFSMSVQIRLPIRINSVINILLVAKIKSQFGDNIANPYTHIKIESVPSRSKAKQTDNAT